MSPEKSSSRKKEKKSSKKDKEKSPTRKSKDKEKDVDPDAAFKKQSSSRTRSRSRPRDRSRSSGRMPRVGSNSSLEGMDGKPKREPRGGKRETRVSATEASSSSDQQQQQHQRPPVAAYSTRTRENRVERETRERRELIGGSRNNGSGVANDDDSAYSSRSGGRSGITSTSALSHEDEIERIRELRARRLRNERLERSSDGIPDSEATDPRRQLRRRGAAEGRPERTRSTPLISRQELEDAGLVRRERSERNRTPRRDSRPERSTTSLSSIPDDEIAAYSRSRRGNDGDGGGSGDDEDRSRYSSRRDRADRSSSGNIADETLSSYRARRERELGISSSSHQDDVSTASSYRSRRDRVGNDEVDSITRSRRERLGASSDARGGEAPIYSARLSDQRRTAGAQRSNLEELRSARLRREASADDKAIPSGSDRSGDGEERERQLPGRTRSAELDSMGQSTRSMSDDSTGGGEGLEQRRSRLAARENELAERRNRLDRVDREERSSDLAERLRERREARAVERQQSGLDSADAANMSSARRKLMRERSNDDMAESTETSPTAPSSNERLSAGAEDKMAAMSPEQRVVGEKKGKTKSAGNDNNDDPQRIPELEFSSDEDETTEGVQSWSIRVNVISAVDLPLNIVPNMPLCPVLKIGLIKIPEGDGPSSVVEKLGSRTIESVQTAKVRSTTSKILSKRDNGAVDFHQQMRWDAVKQPLQAAMCIELCARAVNTPRNLYESPQFNSYKDEAFMATEPTKNVATSAEAAASPGGDSGEPTRGVNRSPSGKGQQEEVGGLRGLWRRATDKRAAELEAAEAAAAVARMLVEDGPSKKVGEGDKDVGNRPLAPAQKALAVAQSDYDVTLQSSAETAKQRQVETTQDQRLGNLIVPLTSLPLEKATKGNEAATVEQWYQLEATDNAHAQTSGAKNPSVLLEIKFSSPQILDNTEDEIEELMEIDETDDPSFNASEKTETSFSKLESTRNVFATGEKQGEKKAEAKGKVEDPVLQSGVIDFISVVGCKDTGKIQNDEGAKGWVESSAEPAILEQFPPNDQFHHDNGRIVSLPGGCEWFCFPEGTRLWRGTSPPSLSDLNLKRFSASSPPNVASSIAAFDACLGCTTSFSWFVLIPPNSDDGSKLVKIYAAVIRFFVPAPLGIDPTQEDFALTIAGEKRVSSTKGGVKRLWVPMAICMTTSLPAVGVMEAMLLRLCEELVDRTGTDGQLNPTKLEDIHSTLANLVVNFQKPIAGAVNCSIPFLGGDRFLLSLPPPTGLPALPHGRALVSVCRLLGAEGLTFLLAAILTECKILFHAQDLADLAMVADVGTALAYPFTWCHAYVPILPLGMGMLEAIEAPFPYIFGIPTSSLKLVDPNALEDVVVIDLDNGFSSDDYFDGRRANRSKSKSSHPLPASVASNISKAVYRLLRAEEEVESEFGETNFGAFNLPGLEQESLAEREFRITVAIEITGLLRGYQECVGTVFNRDKFLKISPSIFEDRRDRGVPALGSRSSSTKVVSARSKRFLSLMVNSQNFHQFIESMDSDEASFFHEIMEMYEDENKNNTRGASDNGLKPEKILPQLAKSLQQVEDKIPTYRVDQKRGFGSDDGFGDDEFFFGDGDEDFHDFDEFGMDPDATNHGDDNIANSFTSALLAPIDLSSQSDDPTSAIERLEANPWDFQRIFDIPAIVDDGIPDPLYTVQEQVKLRDAIGERRYRSWKMAQDQKAGGDADLNFMPDNNLRASKAGSSIDLNSLISSATKDTDASSISSVSTSSLRTSDLTPEQQRVADAKHRDVIRRCMDKTRMRFSTGTSDKNPFVENGRDLIAESEKALRSPSAQRFLLSILSQRSRLENQQRLRTNRRQSIAKATTSRLEPIAFDCLVRLSCAMLDSCMEFKEYEPAYRLLTQTAGFVMILEDDDYDEDEAEGSSKQVITMTSRLGMHPIFAYLEVWETVMSLHHQDRQSERKSDTRSSDDETDEEDEENDEVEYEAAVATLYEMVGYGIPGEELSRFATRASEEHGWFCDDRGRQLLMLARRISIRRDQADSMAAGEDGDIDMIPRGQDEDLATSGEAALSEEHAHSWMEIGWCHPAAPSARTGLQSEKIDSSNVDYIKRSPVTSLACFGSKVVVTGGLDGSVFLAHSIAENMPADGSLPVVRGIHLDWGSASRAGAGSSSDGEYGVGAVSCLAAAGGASQQGSMSSKNHDDIIASMEGSRVVAGTTAGDLRVWSIKDVYSAIMTAKKGEVEEADLKGPGSGGHPSTRLKFSLRGRALSGHRGGVTCIDVPSYVYRPDSLITGGADGLIKLWSLRAPTGGRRAGANSNSESEGSGPQRGRGGDALSVLNGHGGRRVMCIKTAWHGDRLLSGGADRTIRVWDLSGGSGKCLHSLAGHNGWVTKVDYWGPNTIISASTDRSLALWDARVRSSPLFMLRHHQAPVSDFMVGSRTDPLMISAGADGTIATWDFRTLSDSASGEENTTGSKDSVKRCRVVRGPAAMMTHEVVNGSRKIAASSVYLSRVVENPARTFLSTGPDAIVREWVASTGKLVDEAHSGHCDVISSFQSYGRAPNKTAGIGSKIYSHEGTITTSWDGTVRMRRLIDNPK